jgi:hypothetical protein
MTLRNRATGSREIPEQVEVLGVAGLKGSL